MRAARLIVTFLCAARIVRTRYIVRPVCAMEEEFEDIWGDADQIAVTDDDKEKKQAALPKDHVIIIIDARKNMLANNSEGRSFLACALLSAAAHARNKCISDPSAKISVMLMGTEKRNVYGDFKDLYLLQPLQEPTAKFVLKLQKYAEKLEILEAEVGSLAEAGSLLPIDTALWASSHEFGAAGAKATDDKSTWIFTNDDHPNTDSAAAMTRAKDSWANNEAITVFPLQLPNRAPFMNDAFWVNIVAVADDDPALELGATAASSATVPSRVQGGNKGGFAPTSDGTIEDLELKVKSRGTRKRVYARIPLTLAPGIHIAIGVYNTIYPAKKPTSTNVLKGNLSAQVKTESRYLDAETGEVLDEHKMVKYHDFGGTRVLFTDAELKDIKSVTGAGRGLTILGFKPEARIRAIDNLRPPVFLYPSERDLEGSTLVFRALWQRMLDRHLCAICRFEARGTTAPKFVALFAEKERLAEDNAQIVPPGFYAVQLPFADDVRNVTIEVSEADAGTASKEDISAFKEVIEKLSLPMPLDPWEPPCTNPTLQKFYAGLEALALHQRSVHWDPENDDLSRPPVEGQLAEAEEELSRLHDVLDLSNAVTVATKKPSAGVKRKAKDAEGVSDIDWAAEHAAGRIEKHTIDELKDYLRTHGLLLGGKKADLVARVSEHLAKDAGGEQLPAGNQKKKARQ